MIDDDLPIILVVILQFVKRSISIESTLEYHPDFAD